MNRLRHYIFINPHNVNLRKHKKLDFIKRIHLITQKLKYLKFYKQ